MARSSLKNVCRLINRVNEESAPEKEFLYDLKRSIELTDKKHKHKPSKSYKPSSMNCPRNMFYQLRGDEQDPDEKSYAMIGICNAGTDIHVRIQTAVSEMRSNGMDCDYIDVAEFVKQRGLDYLKIVSKNGMETKLFHKTLNISFLCDGIIRYKGHYYILEIKTETAHKFIARTGVDQSHYNQGITYSLSFGLDDVIFLYISRDVLDMKSYRFHVTPEMKEELVGKIENCDEYLKSCTVPPKPEMNAVMKKACRYCPYKIQCEKDS